jgi:hypothetical protein
MPDWLTIDPQLRQFATEGVSPTAMELVASFRYRKTLAD